MKVKLYTFHCPNCKKEFKKPNGRYWCDCNDPPFQLGFGTVREDEQLEKGIELTFKGLGFLYK